ncbi:MAG: hypothetical protein P8O16_17400 [Algoriphagus sp.]|uniref:hypothetical protein n=1 Tax=Algoriphagus sp. TaxID=1872435 RepID=UPI00262BC1DD|nr:hypothetical protein [Algoriphagus sp.]MDG1279059.1 hypothetical protein [Algoriphagus sp.]
MAYSSKIKDPKFDQYLKNTRNYRYQFAFGLGVIAVIGFFLYGEFSDEMDNPEALYIGLVIGGMFLLIGLYSVFSLRPKLDWDGEVAEKEILEKDGKSIFLVYIEDSRGMRHELRAENDPTVYEYYKLGEKVRYHGKLKTFEKFDKSNDDIIFCNACSFLHEISEETCRNCGCPLLK